MIHKKAAKHISVLCLAAICLGVISCGSEGNLVTEQTQTQSAETAVTEIPQEALSPLYELEKKDFGGRDFRISVTDKYTHEMWVESENGDICNDAVYARNQKIEEYFNINIVPVISNITTGGNQAHVNEITNVLMAGDDVYDLTAVYTYLAGQLVLSDLCYNWNDVPVVDFSKEWWVQSANESFSVCGKKFVAVGDLSITTLLLTYAVFFNQRIAENNDFPDLYSMVLDGKWTIDQLITLSKDLYQDVNNDGKTDAQDFYGFACDCNTNINAYHSALDIPMISFNDNGEPYFSLNMDRVQTAVEKVHSLYYDQTAYIDRNSAWTEIGVFANGNAAFLTTWMNHAFTTLRDMKDDYGILPYPKLDEEQKEYYSDSMDNYSLLSVPKTVNDLEFVGYITEAMTRESHFSVMPAFYDVALTEKYARNEQSVAMLDIIMSGRKYDFAILHNDSLAYLPYVFRDLIYSRSTNAASKFASLEKAVNSGIEKLIETYRTLD